MTDRIGGAGSSQRPLATETLETSLNQLTSASGHRPVAWSADHETRFEAQQRLHDESTGEGAAMLATWIKNKAVDYAKGAVKGAVSGAVFKGAADAMGLTYDTAKVVTAREALKNAALGAASVELLPVAGAVGAAAVLTRSVFAKEELQRAGNRDAIDLYVLERGNFQPEFASAQRQRFGPGVSSGRLAQHPQVRARAALIDRQIDVGRTMGLEACKHPGGPQAYLRQNPELARLVEQDVAFAYGWQEVQYYAERNDRGTLAQIGAGIDARTEAERPVPTRAEAPSPAPLRSEGLPCAEAKR